MSDVVIQAKLRVTRSAARESGLRSAGSLDRIAAMDPKESGVTLGYFAGNPPEEQDGRAMREGAKIPSYVVR